MTADPTRSDEWLCVCGHAKCIMPGETHYFGDTLSAGTPCLVAGCDCKQYRPAPAPLTVEEALDAEIEQAWVDHPDPDLDITGFFEGAKWALARVDREPPVPRRQLMAERLVCASESAAYVASAGARAGKSSCRATFTTTTTSAAGCFLTTTASAHFTHPPPHRAHTRRTPMARKPAFAVEFRCEVCDAIPPKDEAASTPNWTVYPLVCPVDGGRVTGRVKDA